MSATLLLAETHARPLARPRTTPRTVRRYPIAEPKGLAAWRLAALDRPAHKAISTAEALLVLECVRRGESLLRTMNIAGVDRSAAFDIVAGVGGRLGQANKSGPRARACVSFPRGARRGLGAGVHEEPDGLVIVMGEGWARTRKEPRDIARSYAAAALADLETGASATARWLANTAENAPITYEHLSHLYGVARGTFATLEGVTTDPRVQDAYLRAFDLLVGSIRQAHQGLRTILDPASTQQEIYAGARSAFWLLGAYAKPIAIRAAAATRHDEPHVSGDLRFVLSQLRDAVQRSPRRFFPGSLGDLSHAQFRAICAHLGFPVPEDDDGARDGTGEKALLAALRARAASIMAAS